MFYMVWDVVSGTQWKLINGLTRTHRMDGLADEAGTSVPNTSRHLQLLEAKGYVSKRRAASEGAGKPANRYSLDCDRAFGGVMSDELTHKTELSLDTPFAAALWKTLLVCKPEDFYYVSSFLTGDILEHVDALAYLRRSPAKIEFFALTGSVGEVREEYSNVRVEQGGEEKEIVCWTHNKEEVGDGLERDDDYYEDLVGDATVLYDPDELMRWNE